MLYRHPRCVRAAIGVLSQFVSPEGLDSTGTIYFLGKRGRPGFLIL